MEFPPSFETSHAMAKSDTTQDPPVFFTLNAMVPGIRPSQILELWSEFRGKMFGNRGVDVICLDPAFHPATQEQLEKWIRFELGRIVDKRRDIETGGNTNQQALLDCDDSAFQLKSAASGLIRTRLSAPLCVGLLACRVTATGREHMVNWVVSARPKKRHFHKEDSDDSPKRPHLNHLQIWIVDVHEAVNAALSDPSNGLPKQILRPLSECADHYSDISFILI
jgi:hypothetical protein